MTPTTRSSLIEVLRPGDVLLYSGRGLYSWIIKIKTWSEISHCETYVGGGFSAASRDGKGVGTYPLRTSQLRYVLRPAGPLQLRSGLRWHASVVGQGYDWLGVIRAFISPRGRGNIGKQWCSEHTARMANKMGLRPFGSYDAEKVSPRDFLTSPYYRVVWDAREES